MSHWRCQWYQVEVDRQLYGISKVTLAEMKITKKSQV